MGSCTIFRTSTEKVKLMLSVTAADVAALLSEMQLCTETPIFHAQIISP